MILLHIKDNLINFLYDKDYFISIYEDYIYVFNYLKIITLTDKLIILNLNKITLEVKGENLFIKKLYPQELLIKGNLNKVGISYGS